MKMKYFLSLVVVPTSLLVIVGSIASACESNSTCEGCTEANCTYVLCGNSTAGSCLNSTQSDNFTCQAENTSPTKISEIHKCTGVLPNSIPDPPTTPNTTTSTTTTTTPTTTTTTTTPTTTTTTTTTPTTTTTTTTPTTTTTTSTTAKSTTTSTSTTSAATPTAAYNTTTSSTTTTTKPSTTTQPPPSIGRRFDAPSFIGGIILAFGLIAIAYVGMKFYRARTEHNYHTLRETLHM